MQTNAIDAKQRGSSTTVYYVNVSILIKFSQKTSLFTLILHKIICFGCVLESPH